MNRIEAYSRFSSDKQDDIAYDLLDKLPHGSGINGKWEIEFGSHGRIFASNCFDAMDEMGGYCHYYDFRATIHYDKKSDKYVLDCLNFLGQRERACCGYDLKSYIIETIDYCLGL
jgi:hypothetical protein